MKHIFISLLILFFINNTVCALDQKIIIEFESNEKYVESKMVVKDIGLVDYIYLDSVTKKSFKFTRSGDVLKWIWLSDKPLIFYGRSMSAVFPSSSGCVLEPGDSIRISFKLGKATFSGRGSAKLELLNRLKHEGRETMTVVNSLANKSKIESLSEFIDLKRTLEELHSRQTNLINEYRERIGENCFVYLQAAYLNFLRFYLTQKFMLVYYYQKDLNLTPDSVTQIYDSTVAIYKPVDKGTPAQVYWTPCVTEFANYAKLESIRKIGFTFEKNEISKYDKRCEEARTMLSGLGLAKVLTDILVYSVLRESVESESIALVNKYMPDIKGYPEYTDFVNDYLAKKTKRENAKYAPAFILHDTSNRAVTLEGLKRKVVFMDFWFTGCKGCVQMSQSLKKVEKLFERNPAVKFLSISIDKSKSQWLSSIAKAKYTTGTATNLYTGGLGEKHPIINDYVVMAYPTIFLISPEGKFINNIPDPRHDNGRGLISLIKQWLPASSTDGPYVLHREGKMIVKSVTPGTGEKPITKEDVVTANQGLKVNTDLEGKTFEVKLKDKLIAEPAEYKKPSRVLAVSDIEGEFSAFRELLQVNKVIDENFNWTFGDGHLVLPGDFFDRGREVTEVLWLIYSLEEKAKAKGGYVHFILGNHEIMNLSGDVRYVHQKYKDNAALLKEDYTKGLYGENSELGRWLRTKNIMEKIGDVLYTHAGISSAMNNINLSLPEINNLVRPYYASNVKAIQGEQLEKLMDSKIGPYWYRGYYKDKNVTQSQIDSTLQKFGVKRIVTGHTIIDKGDKVTTHFNGKVINTDTHHSEGKSEALLIENGLYYRVNADGKKELLFNDKKTF